MPLATSNKTEALANQLASIRGLTADEVIVSALQAELDRGSDNAPAASANPSDTGNDPSAHDFMARVRLLGPWQGPCSTEIAQELYDQDGLPK